MSPQRRTAWVGALALGILALATVPRLNVVLDISSFMLRGDATELAWLSKQVARSEASRTLIVLIEGPTEGQAVSATRKLEEEIRARGGLMERIESLSGGPPEGVDAALWSLYEPRVLSFLANSPEALHRLLSEAGLRSRLEELQSRLRSPASALLSRVAPGDPLLVLPRLFESLAEAGRGGVRVVGNRFVSKSGHGVLFIRTRDSAFHGAAQAPLLQALRSAFQTVNRSGGFELQMGGVHRFAADIEQSIKADIARISILSILALVALVVVVFRSPRIAVLSFTVVLSGFTVGLAVTSEVFGQVHGLTLAFGASLIGVSIDYSVHFFVHHTLASSSEAPRRVLQRIGPGLLLGCLTTVAGFVGLAASSLPGLTEVSVFAGSGILGALLGTWILLPGLVSAEPHRRTPRQLAGGLEQLLIRVARIPRRAWVVPFVGALLTTLLGLPRVTWNNDVARLTHIDPELIREEEAVREEVSPFEQRRFVIATGVDEESALRVNDHIARQLEAAVDAGELARFRSLSVLLPSAETQIAVHEAVNADPDLPHRIRSAAVATGFRADAFGPFVDRLGRAPSSPITFKTLSETPLDDMLGIFRLQLEDGGVGLMTFLDGVRDPGALASRVDSVPGARWLDQRTLYQEASQTYQTRTLWGLFLGWVVVILLVFARYRSVRVLGAAVGPATLAVMATVATLGLVGVPLDLVGLTALLMVFSMGVDYGVFLTESRSERLWFAATALAVVVAWMSTLAGFGLLALSEHPALRTIGVVACVGLSAAVLLTPASLLGMRSLAWMATEDEGGRGEATKTPGSSREADRP